MKWSARKVEEGREPSSWVPLTPEEREYRAAERQAADIRERPRAVCRHCEEVLTENVCTACSLALCAPCRLLCHGAPSLCVPLLVTTHIQGETSQPGR